MLENRSKCEYKSKVIVVEREDTVCEVRINGEMLELINGLKYLECIIDKRGECKKEIENSNARKKSGRSYESVCKKQEIEHRGS